MTPNKALDLVRNYSLYTKQIKALKAIIGNSMDKCKGFSGKRGDLDENFCAVHPRDGDHKGREKDLHLWAWYQPEVTGDGYYSEFELTYQKITKEKHGTECPHCYASHLAIQERKAARKSLGGVKAAMTRSTA